MFVGGRDRQLSVMADVRVSSGVAQGGWPQNGSRGSKVPLFLEVFPSELIFSVLCPGVPGLQRVD